MEKQDLGSAIHTLRTPASSKEDRAEALKTISKLLQQEKKDRPDEYQASLKLIDAFLQEVKTLLK